EVEKLVAVDIFNHDTVATFGHQRIGAGVGRRDDAVIAFEHTLRIGAGKLGANLWADSRNCRGHGNSPSIFKGRATWRRRAHGPNKLSAGKNAWPARIHAFIKEN